MTECNIVESQTAYVRQWKTETLFYLTLVSFFAPALVSDRARRVCRGRLVSLEVTDHRGAMVTQVNQEE